MPGGVGVMAVTGPARARPDVRADVAEAPPGPSTGAAPSSRAARDAPVRPRFDVETLRRHAGPKVFARGEAYHAAGQVLLISLTPERVLAQVSGTEVYRTQLTGGRKRITGECSCRAAEDWGFCKHMVAVGLAANARGDAEMPDPLLRIRAYLEAKGVAALADMIMGMAERDMALLRSLDMAAVSTGASDALVQLRLRQELDAATRTGGYVDRYDVGGWVAGIETVLDAIAELIPSGRADLALGMAEEAVGRIGAALEQIDDSDGATIDLIRRLGQIHHDAAVAARQEPVALARMLFQLELEDGWGVFTGTAATYADVLGEAGRAELQRLAAEAWAALPPRAARSRDRSEHATGYGKLRKMLDHFAALDGDIEARIALRCKDLSSQRSYHDLAQFCHEQGRAAEALRWAEEGLWTFADERPDWELLKLAGELLIDAGRKGDAEALFWRAFEDEPGSELYVRLRKLGGTAARDRAIALLQRHATTAQGKIWANPADLLVTILNRERMFDAAWEAVRKHRTSPAVQDKLARATEQTHRREVLDSYAARVDALAAQGGDHAYAEAAALIGRMAKLRDSAEQAAYVASVKARFSRRRNLMRLLA